MKTNLKKICATILAFAMIFAATIPALAAAPTLDANLVIKGLKKGETANFYQVLEKDETSESGWKLKAPFTGINIDDLLAGKDIDSDLAKAIVAAAATPTGSAIADDNGVATYTGTGDKLTDAEAGLYLVLVTPGDTTVLYNPIFVSADYESDDPNTNTIDLATATGTYNEGDAKKQTPKVEKEMVNPDDKSVMVGQTVPFKITTTIPAYATYDAPKFIITDELSTGIVMADTPNLKVLDGEGNAIASTNYELTNGKAGNTGFTINFTEAYLKTLTKHQDVVVTYDAKVTSDAPHNFNELTNKATIKYSNNPKDKDGHGSHDDITYHYTFTLDGDIEGGSSVTDEWQKTHKEVIKTATDKNGNPILTTVNEYDTVGDGVTSPTKASPLAGAWFELSGDNLEKPLVYETKANGFVVFKGLKAGTYTLKETKAPAGYVIDTKPHTVVIDAFYKKDGQLDYYTVKVDGTTSKFNITTDATSGQKITHVDPNVDTKILPSLLKNIKALALPSTGGIGTVIFYVVGAVLVIGASVVLVTRRRMQER